MIIEYKILKRKEYIDFFENYFFCRLYIMLTVNIIHPLILI